jgi:hypothetical protein
METFFALSRPPASFLLIFSHSPRHIHPSSQPVKTSQLFCLFSPRDHRHHKWMDGIAQLGLAGSISLFMPPIQQHKFAANPPQIPIHGRIFIDSILVLSP